MASRGNSDDQEESDQEIDYEDYTLDDEKSEEEYEEAEVVVVESLEIEVLVVLAGGGDGAREGDEAEGEQVVLVMETRWSIGMDENVKRVGVQLRDNYIVSSSSKLSYLSCSMDF